MYRIITKIFNKNNIRLYHKNIINHFENPKNVGTFDRNLKNIGTGLVGAPACGDVMKLSIKVKENIIIDSKYKTFGCGSAMASSSYITEYIKGLDIDEAYTIENKQVSDELKLPPVKLHCSMLAKDAIQSTIEDYKNNSDHLDF